MAVGANLHQKVHPDHVCFEPRYAAFTYPPTHAWQAECAEKSQGGLEVFVEKEQGLSYR
jgi:hypothetical protein